MDLQKQDKQRPPQSRAESLQLKDKGNMVPASGEKYDDLPDPGDGHALHQRLALIDSKGEFFDNDST
jgi:hypothetical protein